MISLSIHVKKKVRIVNYHLGQLFWPVSQIRLQHNVLGFLVEGHIQLTLLTPSDHPLLVHRHHSNRQTPFEKVCRRRLSTRQQKQCYHHQLKALLSLCREYTIIIWLCTKTRGIRTTMVYYLNSVYCYGAMRVMIYLTG